MKSNNILVVCNLLRPPEIQNTHSYEKLYLRLWLIKFERANLASTKERYERKYMFSSATTFITLQKFEYKQQLPCNKSQGLHREFDNCISVMWH